MRYARVALVADLSAGGPRLHNGTATLIELGGVKLAVTCAHVLEKYRELWLSDRKSIFQVGNVKLEPFAQLISEDCGMDLATIQLSDDQASVLEKGGAQFLLPACWPPGPLREGDWVSLGGYPGTLREHVQLNVLDCPFYSVGATPVSSATETKIGCRFERHRWVWGKRKEGLEDPDDLGGLSGGPAFVLRQLHWELAGIMFEFSRDFDIMFLRPAPAIREDGSIRPLP